MHHRRALGEVGAEANPAAVGDAHTARDDIVEHRRELVEGLDRERPAGGPAGEHDVGDVSDGDGTDVGPGNGVEQGEHAIEVDRVGWRQAVRQQVQAQVDVGGRGRRGVDVDGQSGWADHDATGLVASIAASEVDVDVVGSLLAELAPADPPEPGVERVAAPVLGLEAGTPG